MQNKIGGWDHTVLNATCIFSIESFNFVSILSDSKCEPCITNEHCGFCYDKENPESTGSCLPAFADHPEQYAIFSQNLSGVVTTSNFRCNKTNVWDTERGDRKYYWADSFCPTDYSWMAVLGLALFVMGFAPGILDTLFWSLCVVLLNWIDLCLSKICGYHNFTSVFPRT